MGRLKSKYESPNHIYNDDYRYQWVGREAGTRLEISKLREGELLLTTVALYATGRPLSTQYSYRDDAPDRKITRVI